MLSATPAPTSPSDSSYTPFSAGQFVVTTRVTDVDPSARGEIYTSGGVDSGLHVGVNSNTVPTLGFSYFLTDAVSVEAILGTSQHSITAQGTGTSIPVHKTWVLPPVVALQYHFSPKSRVSPYVGAGINAMAWYSSKNYNGFTVKLKDGVGTALQAGVDIALAGPWALNLDYKKVFYKTRATINGGALTSEVKLDPAVMSIGIERRF